MVGKSRDRRVTPLNYSNYSYPLTYWAGQVGAHTNTLPPSPNILSYLNTCPTTQHQTIISDFQMSFVLFYLPGHTTTHGPPCCPLSQRWALASLTSGLITLTTGHLYLSGNVHLISLRHLIFRCQKIGLYWLDTSCHSICVCLGDKDNYQNAQ